MEAYEILSTIGTGTFGVVQKVRRRADGRTLVWKAVQFRHMKIKEKELLVQEVNLLNRLRHPNIVRCYDRLIDRKSGTIYIVQEYAEGGDLAHLIQRCSASGTHISEQVLWRVAAQLLSALEYCHSGGVGDGGAGLPGDCSPAGSGGDGENVEPNGAAHTAPLSTNSIMHRDLKPGNVFLDGNGDVKLGDFGLARVLSPQSAHAQTWVGTPYYMSPEQLRGERYDERCDIWSLGALLYEAAALRPPFMADSQRELSEKIQRGQCALPLTRYSDEWNDFLRRMLQVDARRRPTAKELLRQPSVREFFLRRMYKELKRRERAVEEREREAERMMAEARALSSAASRKPDPVRATTPTTQVRRSSSNYPLLPSRYSTSPPMNDALGSLLG